jgi:hypothetical protein
MTASLAARGLSPTVGYASLRRSNREPTIKRWCSSSCRHRWTFGCRLKSPRCLILLYDTPIILCPGPPRGPWDPSPPVGGNPRPRSRVRAGWEPKPALGLARSGLRGLGERRGRAIRRRAEAEPRIAPRARVRVAGQGEETCSMARDGCEFPRGASAGLPGDEGVLGERAVTAS